MQKKVFKNAQITCMFQNTTRFGEESAVDSQSSTQESLLQPVIYGMLSHKAANHFLFQETLPRPRELRNTKLYQGSLVSLVRRKDGYYYPVMRGLSLDDSTDKATLAFRIYSEISEALNSIG